MMGVPFRFIPFRFVGDLEEVEATGSVQPDPSWDVAMPCYFHDFLGLILAHSTRAAPDA